MTLLKDYQPIEYPDESLLEKCQLELSQKSPLISIQEINHLKDLLVEVHCQRGPPQLIVQFGHCAETFSNNSYASFLSFAGLFEKIKRKLQKRNIQLIPILRMAGQFAKPRTFLHEEVSSEDGTFIVPTYRGDLVNGPAIHERIPNPERLLRAYEESNLALQYIKDAFVCESIFTMHEFLSLPYEKALIRSKVHGGKYSLNSSPFSDTLVSHTAVYSSSAHALWLGDRTAFSDSVHTHLLAGIENPIGIKVGPSKSPKSILEILDILNPTKVLGKIMLITRFGAQNVESMLPNFIRAIQKSGHSVLWICDPMHGNTQSIPMGELGNKSTLKTRDFQDILEETLKTFRIHKDLGTFCSGLHLESSEDPLTTECLGGVTEPLLRTDLCHGQYTTTCDPRLNPAQVLDLFNCLLDDFIF